MTALPVNLDTTYADDGSDASVKDHQQHHDTVHGLLNTTTIDSVEAHRLIDMTGDADGDTNGFVVKVNGTTPSGYGHGQPFMVLEEGAGDATDQTASGSVLFRIDEKGGIGATGALHVAAGLRKATGGAQAAWIDPSENIIGLVIHNPTSGESATWDKDFMRVVNVRNSNEQVFKIDSTGAVSSTRNITARTGLAERVAIGDFFGFAGVSFGSAGDTLIFRAAANIIGMPNVIQGTETTDPAAPAANGYRLFAKDNGSGKTQLCVRFNTGAVQVIATEP